MLTFDPERVRGNIRQATTEDLLDRATAYRAGMEPQALELIEAELRERGIGPGQIDTHARRHEAAAFWHADGTARPCAFCHRPAVAQGWGWHRLWGLLPVFPRHSFYCGTHQPRVRATTDSAGAEPTDGSTPCHQ